VNNSTMLSIVVEKEVQAWIFSQCAVASRLAYYGSEYECVHAYKKRYRDATSPRGREAGTVIVKCIERDVVGVTSLVAL
jgi:hypothetical protein